MNPNVKPRISKFLTLLLRHRPDDFGLKVDSYGFANVEDVLNIVGERFPGITRSDLEDLTKDEERPRFEIFGDLIRARYGHSFPVDLGIEPFEPPEFLYNGTDRNSIESIMSEGLRPSGRHYVHLSLSSEVAEQIASRKSSDPVLLRIYAKEAHRSGIEFYDRTPVILTEAVPPEFLEIIEEEGEEKAMTYGRRKRRRNWL